MKISFAEFELPRSGAVVVGVAEEGVLTPSARQLDEATGGAVGRALAASPRFRGKRNELVPVIGPPNLAASRIVLAGLGKLEAIDPRALEDLGGALVAHLNNVGETQAMLAIDVGDTASLDPAEAAAHLAFGAALRAYRFDKYRTTERPERKPTLSALTVAGPAAAAERAYKSLAATAESVAFTRDLVSEPANVIYPETLAEQAAGLASIGLDVEILDEGRIAALGMGALL